MIVVRHTFQVKFGRMKDALPLMRENLARAKSAGYRAGRLLTDVTGGFYTLVLELEYENMAEAEKSGSDVMKLPGWQETYQRFAALVDSGHREVFSIVS